MASSFSHFRPRQRPPRSGRALPSPLPDTLVSYIQGADASIGEGFRGVTTDGQVVPGLFPIQRTGVSMRPIKDAVEAFLAALSPEQRAKTVFPVDSDEWRRWSNIHLYVMRHGAPLDELSPAQREQALGVLRQSLSARGFETARDVMKLNETIAEITGRFEEYGEWLYWLSVMGTPSGDEPWGWQIDGHHLIVNCFVLKDQVVMTPVFMGTEPVAAEGGKYAGTRAFQAEEDDGLALMRDLTADQRGQATLADQVPREVFTTAFRDNFELRYEGIRYDDLLPDQQSRLLGLVETYVGRMRPD